MDFSKTRVHCSSLYCMMPNSKIKTPMQLFKEAVALREKKETMYERLKKKDGTRGLELVTDLAELEVLIPKLESYKDEDLPLSVGNKSYLAGLYAFEKYGKWSPNKDTGSRQTEKGKEVEGDGIALVSVLDGVILDKNDEVLEDEWFSGHPDAFEGENLQNAEIIHDIKCPWDIETFLSYVGKPLPDIYYWQMQGYMALTGAKIAYIHFCMIDTPMRFIKDAADRMLKNMNVVTEESPAYKKALKEIINNMTFHDIPQEERRIKFIVERNDEDIAYARKRVEKGRLYLQEFENLHLNYDQTCSTLENEVPLIQMES